jgi:hypothetical protein
MGLSTNEKRLVKNLILKKDLFIMQRIVGYLVITDGTGP